MLGHTHRYVCIGRSCCAVQRNGNHSVDILRFVRFNQSSQWIPRQSKCTNVFRFFSLTDFVLFDSFDCIADSRFRNVLQHRIRSISIIGLALTTIVQLRLSLPGPTTAFSTADNPIAKSTSLWTRFLTFAYLPAFNFKLLVYPSQLSFDWGMDAIPRLNTFFDARNLISLTFYGMLSLLVLVNVNHIYQHWTRIAASISASEHYRKPRIVKKRKMFPPSLCSVNTNNTNNNNNDNFHNNNNLSNNNNSLINNNNNNCSYLDNKNITNSTNNNNNSTTVNNNYLTKITDCLCSICKEGLNIRHSSSCRAINNNNAPLTHCGCPPTVAKRQSPSPSSQSRMVSSPSPHASKHNGSHHVDQQQQQHHHHNQQSQKPTQTIPASTATTIANVFFALPTIWIGGRCHKRSSTIKNPSANNRAENKPFSSSNVSNSHHHRETGEKSYPPSTTMQPPTTTSAAILLSIALLAFPFLPAANLFFYVGFVVAERILYLPSVGYCLLIGLGVGKLIDSNHGPLSKRRKRYAIQLCVCMLLVAYSVKTITRNVDWHNEESLYRSAIQINPPKGNYIILYYILY